MMHITAAAGDPALLVVAVFAVAGLASILVYQAMALRDRKQQIEERNRLLQESNALLQQAAALGLHTAEICHNLNHFLQTRQLFTQLLDEQGWHPDFVRHLETSNRNMQQVVRRAQSFLAGTPLPAREHSLRDTIEAALSTMRAHLGRDLHATLDTTPGATFRFDDSLSEVLNNILINAGESMRSLADARLDIQATSDCIIVRDTGSGIPPEWMDSLFIARATPQGHVAGLGLAFLRNACLRNGCMMEVSSSNQGTCVTITRRETGDSTGQRT